MSIKVCGDVWHKGKIVPVEVEVCANWLNQPGIVVHIPKEYSGTSDLVHMIDFTADLDKEVRPVNSVATRSLTDSVSFNTPKEEIKEKNPYDDLLKP